MQLRPYERVALEQMVITVRAIAGVISKDPDQANRMKNWAQIVEEALEREPVSARQIVAEEWHAAVKEYELRPGSVTETVIARIVNRLDGDPPRPEPSVPFRKG